MATKAKKARASRLANAQRSESPLRRPLVTPEPPTHWKPAKSRSPLRNRARKRERYVATRIFEQVSEGKHRYKAAFGELAPDPERLLKQLDVAIVLERERVLATTWLAYLEEESQRAWADAAQAVRRLATVYGLVEKVRGKPAGFDAVAFFKEARSAAAKKAGATKRAKRAK